MALSRLAGLVCVEAVVAKLRLLKPPAGPPGLLDKTAPLVGGESASDSARLAQLDPMRQDSRRIPIAQHDFTNGKRSDQTEFVGGRIERIPKRLKGPAALLCEHFPGPNVFGHVPLFCFEGGEFGCDLPADPAADAARINGDRRSAPRANQKTSKAD